jgi:tetratricopeptide (TPR) repeat protein
MTERHRIGRNQLLVALTGIVVLCSPVVVDGFAGPLLPGPMAAQVATAGSQPFATLEAARGRVTIIRLGRAELTSPPMPLQLDDIIVTKEGRATVRFNADGTVLRIGPDSRVQVNETATERNVSVFFGRLWAHVVRFKEQTTRFATGSTIAAIRGTEVTFAVAVDGDETQVAVLEGQVEATTDTRSLVIDAGQPAVGKKGKAPTRQVRVKPTDTVQWALYYLPVLYTKPGELGEGQAWQGKARESAEAYLGGDLAAAIDSVEGIADVDIKEPRFFTYRASLLLASGNVEKAGQDIEKALSLAPKNSEALALQSIIAVARNQVDRALSTADRAVAADPRSATAQIARSYALQAKFDLEGARKSLETAVELAPDDALAWARLAEIRSSLGDLNGALEAAQKAVELEPNLSRTQAVLGFAHLTRVQTREAADAFQKAIGLDQDDPLPRLGLGLAKIREGELKEGLADIEVAVGLDPGQALVRSYLGNAYFEAKRKGLDEREYEVAKGLDPNDPTPWLYDAIAKQTTNRPVEALRSVEKAIELNDNRAVYRSRLMLDSDLASRSASLGRIFVDLGFQSLGLVEGWTSVNTDPTNYSAHRLLADTYAALPRHEIARVSELFQSQMLQPANTTPIQPRLGESSLFLIASQGPAALSFNEFNPLFNRDQVNVQASLMGGEDSTMAGELIVSGIADKLSYSIGYSSFETDGFRDNDDQDDQIANAFLQLELGPKTSLQAEYRYRDTERGDLRLRFFPDDYFPGERREEERNTGRLGLRHSFSPGSVLLASVMYQDLKGSVSDDQPGFPLTFVGDTESQEAVGSEAQYLFRSRHFDVTAGVGYFDIDGTIDATVEIDPELVPPPDNVFTATIDTTLKHTNVYAYANLKPAEQFMATLGVSSDYLDGNSPEVENQDEVNPKVGIIWKPFAGTTLRAAGFKTLKRTLITDQTLEPTQVAGFNQFYDDLNGTRATRYGGALDQKFGTSVFGGLEYSERDLEIPYLPDPSNPVAEYEDANESLARAYLFITPHARWALRAEYVIEEFTSEGLTELPTRVETDRVPVGISFFHPSGFSAWLTGTYVTQDGDFIRIDGTPESGSDEFWTVDAAISYRLPKRHGFIAVGATNLFDEQFNYYDTDVRNPVMQPARRFYARVTVAF